MAYLLMLGAILKHLVTGEYGPLDRLLEFLVFVLILYEVGSGIVRHHRAKKRQRLLNEQREFLARLIRAGEQLKESLPGMSGAQMFTAEYHREAEAWRRKIIFWVSNTAQGLRERSARTESAFMNVRDTNPSPGFASKADGTIWYFQQDISAHYRKLVAHLDNLQKIVANPELYF
jgi:hypothetical protein